MQTLGLLLPAEYAQRVIQARAKLADDPALGRILDPPFAHFTLQMAEGYDWSDLEVALTEFARQQAPFQIRTVGLLTVTGPSTGVTLEPYRDDRLAAFHAALWQVVTPFARGEVAPFYLPDRWVPHVTIKRCGPNREAFGRAMAALSADNFIWTMQIDALTVQHDPDNNNLTRYQRLHVALGETTPAAPPDAKGLANATILEVVGPTPGDHQPIWTVTIQGDDGSVVEVAWSAPEMVHIMAAAKAALTFFPGARCTVAGDRIVWVEANTPAPVRR
jgi:2'-5' RNA ligase